MATPEEDSALVATEEARKSVEDSQKERVAKLALLRRINIDFKYHSPREGQPAQYAMVRVRAGAHRLAETMIDECPISRELSTAVTTLETAVMHASAAIRRHG